MAPYPYPAQISTPPTATCRHVRADGRLSSSLRLPPSGSMAGRPNERYTHSPDAPSPTDSWGGRGSVGRGGQPAVTIVMEAMLKGGQPDENSELWVSTPGQVRQTRGGPGGAGRATTRQLTLLPRVWLAALAAA